MEAQEQSDMETMQKEYLLNILGSEWKLKVCKVEEEPKLQEADGLTDRSSKTMIVRDDQEGVEYPLDDYPAYQKEVKRHEIIHAFLYESGLGNELTHPSFGHDELSISWFAIQFPKIYEVFVKADAI